uniref:Putative Gag-Pol polyprotein n=1 Tax=Tanacetum cinerariifolium TaxID=118510 RepID=A0A699I111_TANCI|nr:putative Gag-Pol polyprotein [Tanacetum cinerariifolium]
MRGKGWMNSGFDPVLYLLLGPRVLYWAWADGPLRVLKKINDNPYKLEVPDHYNVSATFNVADLSPYVGTRDDEIDSMASSFQDGEDDAGTLDHSVNMAAYLTF